MLCRRERRLRVSSTPQEGIVVVAVPSNPIETCLQDLLARASSIARVGAISGCELMASPGAASHQQTLAASCSFQGQLLFGVSTNASGTKAEAEGLLLNGPGVSRPPFRSTLCRPPDSSDSMAAASAVLPTGKLSDRLIEAKAQVMQGMNTHLPQNIQGAAEEGET